MRVSPDAKMKPEPPKDRRSKSRRWFWIILPIVFFGVLGGGLCAFYDYYNQYFNRWSFSRRLSRDVVQQDSESVVARRFLYGAAGGSFLGILIVLRSREKD